MLHHYLKVLASKQDFTEEYFNHINLEQFSKKIVNAGIASLLYPKIQGIRDFLPDQFLQFLRTLYENALLYRDYSLYILRELQPRMTDTGRIVLTQGIALTEIIYHEPLYRSMGDIDLYLPDGNSNEVKRILKEYGFKQYRDYENVLEFKQIMIDLHDGLWGTDRFKERRYIVPEKNVVFQPSNLIDGFYILNPEHLALHCAFHGMKHSFSKEIWSLDLILLHSKGYFSTTSGNWQELILKALSFEHLAQNSFMKPVTLKSSRYHPSLPVKKSITAFMTINKRIDTGQIAMMLMCPSIIKSIRYLFTLFLPPKNILYQMYGTLPYPILIVIRIYNILKHAGRVLIWRR